MEQSKLINSVMVRLKLAYPSYFNTLSNEELIILTKLYQEELSSFNENTLTTAIKNIIRSSKYMPTLKDILDECNKFKNHNFNAIIERMKRDGYFKNANEVDKIYQWLNEGIIPKWLKDEMKNYISKEITTGETLLLR